MSEEVLNPRLHKEKDVIENIKFIFDGVTGLDFDYTFHLKLTNFKEVYVTLEKIKKSNERFRTELFDAGLNFEQVKLVHQVFGQIIDMVENSNLEEKVIKSKNPTDIQLSFDLPTNN